MWVIADVALPPEVLPPDNSGKLIWLIIAAAVLAAAAVFMIIRKKRSKAFSEEPGQDTVDHNEGRPITPGMVSDKEKKG